MNIKEIGKAFIEAFRKKEGHVINVAEKYNGVRASIFSAIGDDIIGETVLHGFIGEAYVSGKVKLVGITFAGDNACWESVDKFVVKCYEYARRNGLTLLGYDPQKAVQTRMTKDSNGKWQYRSVGFVAFWRGSYKDLAIAMTRIAGFRGDSVLPYIIANPEKGWKYLNARIELGTVGSTLYWNMKRDFVSLTGKLRNLVGDSTVVVDEYLYDGFAVMSSEHQWAIANNLPAGWIGQVRGHANKDWDGNPVDINCAKGVVYIASEKHFRSWTKFHGLKGDLAQVLIGTTNFLKNTEEGRGYWIPNLGIHARWDDHDGRDRGVLGVQALHRSASGNQKSLVFKQVEDQIKGLVPAIRQALTEYKTDMLGEYLGKLSLADIDAEDYLDAASLIRLGRDWREVSRLKSADHLLGKLVTQAGKASITGWRDYVMSPLFYMVATGRAMAQGSIVLSPEASAVKDFGHYVNAFRNPIISKVGAVVPFEKVTDPEWIYHGSTMWHFLDKKGRLFAGASMDEDFDGDKIFIFGQKWLKVDFAGYWNEATEFVSSVNDWKESKDVSILGFGSLEMPAFQTKRARSLWLAQLAGQGIPIADAHVGRMFMEGNCDTWQDKCAYQSIVELIKHTTEEAVVNPMGLAEDFPTYMSEVYRTIKSGKAFSEMASAVEKAAAALLAQEISKGHCARRIQKLWIEEMGKLFRDVKYDTWKGVKYPEFVAANRPNRLISFLMGIVNLRPMTKDAGWTLPAAVTIYQKLHMEIAKRVGKTALDMGSMEPMSAVKNTVVARIQGLLDWHAEVLELQNKNIRGGFASITPETHFGVMGTRMGVSFGKANAITHNKLLAYTQEMRAMLTMGHEEFAGLIVEALWWSFAASESHESNLWYLGGKTIAMLLDESGKPEFIKEFSKPDSTEDVVIGEAFV